MKLTQSAVKQYAVEKGLHVLQPEKLKNPDFLAELKALQADIQLVVAFRMLPELVWNMPPMGSINLHGSLLPQYRGAAPINWAVINGETETGVTTFKLQHAIDTGDILLQERFPIGQDETAGEVHDRMKEIGARVLVETVKGLAAGTLTETPQKLVGSHESGVGSKEQATIPDSGLPANDSRLRHAPKIFTETCKIDWTKPVDHIYNLIRGLSPYPAAFTVLQDKTMKIYRAKKEQAATVAAAGEWKTDQKSFLKFAGADGYIHVTELQLEGKKKMTVEEFLRGYRF